MFVYYKGAGVRGSVVVKALCYTKRKVAGLIPEEVIFLKFT
jgi:hypothetical protein